MPLPLALLPPTQENEIAGVELTRLAMTRSFTKISWRPTQILPQVGRVNDDCEMKGYGQPAQLRPLILDFSPSSESSGFPQGGSAHGPPRAQRPGWFLKPRACRGDVTTLTVLDGVSLGASPSTGVFIRSARSNRQPSCRLLTVAR